MWISTPLFHAQAYYDMDLICMASDHYDLWLVALHQVSPCDGKQFQ